jgi:hypothetical protein
MLSHHRRPPSIRDSRNIDGITLRSGGKCKVFQQNRPKADIRVLRLQKIV